MKSALIKKIPNSELKNLFTFNAKAAIESLKNPGKAAGAELPKGDSSKKPFVLVFRHGESVDNVARIHSGWRDKTKLTETGEEQALLLVEKLKDIHFDYYFQSDQVRSQKTLQIAMGKREFTPVTEWRIKERNYGDLNGTSKIDLMKKDPLMAILYRRSWDYPPPHGESVQMVYYRVLSFLKELEYVLKKEKASAVISCSGNSMKAIRRYFENLSEEETAVINNPTGKDYCLYNL